MDKTTEFLYRYVTRYSGIYNEIIVDIGDGIDEESLYIAINMYRIIKRTKCGAFINVENRQKFVNLESKKQFASETKERAKECFVARKSMQVRILTGQLDQAKKELEYITGGK